MAPGESTPAKTAPQPLYLVQRFVNSVDLESGEDELSSPEALRDWFAERGLMDGGDAVSPADLRRAIDVREGLRAVLRHNNGHPLDRSAWSGSTGPSGAPASACASRAAATPSSCPTPTAWTARWRA